MRNLILGDAEMESEGEYLLNVENVSVTEAKKNELRAEGETEIQFKTRKEDYGVPF